jgi:hypothetical protein
MLTRSEANEFRELAPYPKVQTFRIGVNQTTKSKQWHQFMWTVTTIIHQLPTPHRTEQLSQPRNIVPDDALSQS